MEHKIYSILSFLLLVWFVMSLGISPVHAQSVTATFEMSPATKSVKVGQTFTVDVNIKATSNKRVGYARAVMAFDPTLLQMTQAVQHGTVFCNFPSDGSNYVADNSQGIIMVTGISTGTQACPFPEITDTADLFVRISFKAKKSGTANVQFLFNGQQAAGFSGITDTNSPPQFIMSTPQDGQYKIASTSTPKPTAKPPGNLGVDPRISLVIAGSFVVMGYFLIKRKSTQRVVTLTEVL